MLCASIRPCGARESRGDVTNGSQAGRQTGSGSRKKEFILVYVGEYAWMAWVLEKGYVIELVVRETAQRRDGRKVLHTAHDDVDAFCACSGDVVL